MSFNSSMTAAVLLFLISNPSVSQSVSSISFQQTANNRIQINYYLACGPTQSFEVRIFASTDGGRSFIETKSVSGDVGHISGSGWKSATWDVLKDVAQFTGSKCEFRVQAMEIRSFGDAIATFYSGSQSTRRFVNGFSVYGGWQNTTFTNSAFSNSIASGTLTNAGGWNAGARYVRLPFLLDANYVSQTFRIEGSRYTVIYQGLNLSANFIVMPLSDYFDAFGGIGFQASELSISNEPLESDAQTNGAFWNAGAQINVTSSWRLGVQYSESFTAGDRNWRQILLFAGFNFSSQPGAGE